ncbi:hypothetical protein [Methyloceanibacter sp.]|uniref:hypothetical protein n=1 Tax=Methyloceanibacter sp. TaxID=1965321 RepID=UPI002B707DF0|nr:hypothetical protein [Methyloceanibacter sp.]HML93400.1 hypothetical protein [Methyloceanibacter sp.]
MLNTPDRPQVIATGESRHALFELEPVIRKADRLANAIRMLCNYGQHVEEGLTTENLEAVLEVTYDLIDSLGTVKTGYYKAFEGICGPKSRKVQP